MDREYLNWAMLFILIAIVFVAVMIIRAKSIARKHEADKRKKG